MAEEGHFTDVTLVCDGDKQVLAHKVILSAASPFFKQILIKNPHQHPLIYLKGVKYCDLISVVNFVYQGEAQLRISDFDSFWSLAEELEVKGLNGIFFQPATHNLLNENIKHSDLEFKEKLMETDLENDYESFLNTLTIKEDKEDIAHEVLDNGDDDKTETEKVEKESHIFSKSNSKASMKDFFSRTKTKDRMKKIDSANSLNEADLSESFKYEPCQNGVHSRFTENPQTKTFVCQKCLTRCKTLENLHRHMELLDHY